MDQILNGQTMILHGSYILGKRYKTMTEQELEDIMNEAFGKTFWRYLAYIWSGLEEDY